MLHKYDSGGIKVAIRRAKGRFGPGFVIAAAFIGPGTVITCTSSGTGFGTDLLWALLFAGVTTLVLQEMAVRLGLTTGKDLATNLREVAVGRWQRVFICVLAAAAIVFGCAAYQVGNLVGGAAGISVILGGDLWIWVVVQTAVAVTLLWTGKYVYIERFLTSLVALMCFCFILAAVVFAPALPSVLHGLFIPSLPSGSLLTVLALIGTTVVPYNLFLHSRIIGEKWSGKGELGTARIDLLLAVAIGIAASISISVTAAGALKGTEINDVVSFAGPLRKLLGWFGSGVFGFGLWAAGMTSAITAPLAAAYTVAGVSGWGKDAKHPGFRAIWLVVIAIGVFFAVTSARPIPLIVTAQALNGIILPLAAVFLLLTMNSRRRLGELRNGIAANIFGVAFLLVVAALSVRYLLSAFGWL
jgi:manganese transport protein